MRKTIIINIFLFLSVFLHGQDIKQFSSVRTNGGQEKACSGIVLLPGFSFNAVSTGQSLSFEVDERVCTPEISFPTEISSNQNYIVTMIPMGKTKSVEFNNGNITIDRTEEKNIQAQVNIQYYDGLGRPVQTVQRGITPNHQDLVSQLDYDAFGRESKAWLPSPASGNGSYQSNISDQATIYHNDENAFNETKYEASPLNRPLEQYGPGQNWRTGDGKSVKTLYLTNTANGELSCIHFAITGSGLTTGIARKGMYQPGELYVIRMINEDGNKSYEFKNKLGQVVLTRQMDGTDHFDTYYVYDDLGRLCYVFPPALADDNYSTHRGTQNTDREKYAYSYWYDSRGRCIRKQLPGCTYINYVYDKADQLIFTQDGEQRKRAEWTFSIPDAFGRPVLTGTCKNTISDIQNYLSDAVVRATAKFDNTAAYKGYNISGVSLTSATILTANYYDNYGFLNLTDFTNSIEGHTLTYDGSKAEFNTRYGNDSDMLAAKGMLTGNIVAVLQDDVNQQLYNLNSFYYDFEGNRVQSQARSMARAPYYNAEAIDREYISYNFTGQPVKRYVFHEYPGWMEQEETYTYIYDHAGRLTQKKYKLNNQPEFILADNTYDDLGRLMTTTVNNSSKLRTAYSYNIRSWTTKINSYHFIQNLEYTHGGNVKTMNWMQNGIGHTYSLEYDALSRLTYANYNGENNNLSTFYVYDKNGNMEQLDRDMPNGYYDALTMEYNGNQLIRVEDAGNSSVSYPEFRDYYDGDIEYAYNNNGAMTKDLNKGISDIQYNVLNLPKQVDIKSPVAEARNRYVYSAAGERLSVRKQWNRNYSPAPVIGSGVNTSSFNWGEDIEYVKNKVYNNGGDLDRVMIDNGYYKEQGYPNNGFFFYIKDHLGNNRIVADANGDVVQSTEYYPFGLPTAQSTNPDKQQNKYNDKELDMMHGLNLYDYHARQQDPELGRFTTLDPLAEKYYSISPYAYVANNPFRYTDPTGMFLSTHTDKEGNVIAVYDDGDLGVYKHQTAKTKGDIDKLRTETNSKGGGGTKMGETWTALGFADFSHYERTGEVKAAEGAKIDFESNWATEKVSKIANSEPSLVEYQSKAGTNGVWDLKAHTPNGNVYYGSLLFGKYASARDAGNFAAGIVSVQVTTPTSIVDFGFGAYNMTNNSKFGAGIVTGVVAGITTITPSLGIEIGKAIGKWGEDKLSKAGISAGQKYQKAKK